MGPRDQSEWLPLQADSLGAIPPSLYPTARGQASDEPRFTLSPGKCPLDRPSIAYSSGANSSPFPTKTLHYEFQPSNLSP